MVDFVICNMVVDWVTSSSAVQRGDTICSKSAIQCVQNSTDVQNSLMDSVGEGEGGKIWENGIETCKISCMK